MTVKEHLQKALPEEYFNLVKVYLVDSDERYIEVKTEQMEFASTALIKGFVWKNTIEKQLFWSNVHDTLMRFDYAHPPFDESFPSIPNPRKYLIDLLKVT